MTHTNLIVAATNDMGIGINGSLPWRLSKDMKYFQELTTTFKRTNLPKNACIMGRKTWESIPKKFRPLSDRLNIVLSRQSLQLKDENAIGCDSLDSAIEIAKNLNCPTIWIIGGAQIYKLAAPKADYLFLTRVFPSETIACDTFLDIPFEMFERVTDVEFRQILPQESPEKQQEGTFEFQFEIWKHK